MLESAAQSPGGQERLLLVAALTDPQTAKNAWLELAPGLDIDVVAHETHGVFAQLADNLRAMDLDPAILPRLDGVRKRLWANNSQRLRAVLTARDRLSGAGIAAEPTGGLAVLLTMGDAAGRPMVDAELVVHEDQVSEAVRLLLDDGWQASVRRRDGWLLDLRSITLVNGKSSVTLRWRAGGWPYATGEESPCSAPTGESVRLPSSGRLMAWTLIEGYRLWGYNPTRRYADAMLLSREMDDEEWQVLLQLTRVRHGAVPVSAALHLLAGPLCIPVPDVVVDDLARYPGAGRGRLSLRIAERSGTAAAFLRRTDRLTPVRALGSVPAFLRDVWDVDGREGLPQVTLRRLRARGLR